MVPAAPPRRTLQNRYWTPSRPTRPSIRMPFESAVAVCARLIAPRPFATPPVLEVDPAAGSLYIDTGFDRFTLTTTLGDLEWLAAAHRLGGLLVRVLPTTSPDRVALLACWENQTISISGIPSA